MFLIVLLVGILAGSTPAGNAIIDFGDLTGTLAGSVWLWISVTMGMMAAILYWLEENHVTYGGN